MTPEQSAVLRAQTAETAAAAAALAGKAGAVLGQKALDLGDAMADPRKRRATILVGGAVAGVVVLVAIAIPVWNMADAFFERRAAEQRVEAMRLAREAQRLEREAQEALRRAQAQAEAEARRQEQERLNQLRQAQQPTPTLPAPRAPVVVSGPAILQDTATLEVSGTRVALIGLVPVPHPGALGAARAYLQSNGSNVNCRAPAQNPQVMECTLIGRGTDVGEVFVLSGFATAMPNAPAKIRQAEAQARQNRAGVWGQ